MVTIQVSKVAPGRNGLPFDPYVELTLFSSSMDSAGKALLSPQLASDKEIDVFVNDLIEKLERARKKAKEELRRAKGLSI
jgi:hypothetical protein